jgi:hypothetical protein
MEPFVGAFWEYLGLIIYIETKPLDTEPFSITYRESEVSPDASRGATGTMVLH